MIIFVSAAVSKYIYCSRRQRIKQWPIFPTWILKTHPPSRRHWDHPHHKCHRTIYSHHPHWCTDTLLHHTRHLRRHRRFDESMTTMPIVDEMTRMETRMTNFGFPTCYCCYWSTSLPCASFRALPKRNKKYCMSCFVAALEIFVPRVIDGVAWVFLLSNST